jgi:hypothetical protein
LTSHAEALDAKTTSGVFSMGSILRTRSDGLSFNPLRWMLWRGTRSKHAALHPSATARAFTDATTSVSSTEPGMAFAATAQGYQQQVIKVPIAIAMGALRSMVTP